MASLWLSLRLVLDRIIAIFGAIATAPLVALIAVLVKRHDGGRPLIRVPRVGRDGAIFDMWKIRSMYMDTGDGRASGASLTASEDKRITPIGRRIRALHLDEIPQLYNVAKGEMGILGPRPEAPPFVDLKDPSWQAVLTVPPGIAGPTQIIVGEWEKSVIDADETGSAYVRDVVPVKLAIDRWYVESATLLTDLVVVWSLVLNAAERTPRMLQRIVRRAVPSSRVVDEPTRGR